MKLKAVIFFLSFPAILLADELSNKDWLEYFAPDEDEVVEYRITISSPFSTQHFNQREKNKGMVDLDGKRYRKSVVVFDSGPWANKSSEVFTLVSEKGLYQRKADGEEQLLVPRPLTSGQTWKNGEETYRFEGIEDFETFDTSVPKCVKITVTKKSSDKDGEIEESKEIKYYQKGKGLIYKSAEIDGFSSTKILKEYASKETEP